MLLYPFDNPNRFLFVRSYFLFCSRVIISRSYGNRSKAMNIICLESYMARKEEEKKGFFRGLYISSLCQHFGIKLFKVVTRLS